MKLTVRFEVGGGGGEMGMIITGLLGREVGEWRPKLEAQYFQGGGGEGGEDSHMEGAGVVVVSLRGCKLRILVSLWLSAMFLA